MSPTRKAPGIINSVKRPVPLPGEDEVSYERHTKALQAEFKKTNHNNALISDLMQRSFALRRMEILEKNYGLTALLSRFPFLQEADEVHNHIGCKHTHLHVLYLCLALLSILQPVIVIYVYHICIIGVVYY